MYLIVGSAIVLTALAVVIGLNFIGGEKKIEHHIERLYSLDDPRFRYELGLLLGPPFVAGNRSQALLNGDQIFPSMLAAIREAKSSITFETYIYWSGDIGRAFADALVAARSRGVRTHVLLDWVGSAKMSQALIDEMTSAGIEVHKFHPPSWLHLGRLNNRTHRKELIVDGKIAFTGGVGIAPEWTGHAQDPEHWRDTHFRVEGPVVAQIQSVFMDNWLKVTGRVLHGDAYFPTLAPAGNELAQMFSSSPSGGSESMQLMYLLAITAASRSIDLSAAYFVPDDLSVRALLEAMQRGVRVRIVVPGKHIDSDTVRGASRARWGPLLKAGALIAEYQPTMFHCKVLIVDQLLVAVGSTNFDNRSFRLNDEATLNIFDTAFAVEQTRIFEDDLKLAQAISYAQWEHRPLREKAAEQLASLIGAQL